MDKSLAELKQMNGRRDLPWKVTDKNAVTDNFGWAIFVDEANDAVGTATPQDAQLVALAPELLAEVIRMREEIAILRNRARLELKTGDMEPDGLIYAELVERELTRILGDEA